MTYFNKHQIGLAALLLCSSYLGLGVAIADPIPADRQYLMDQGQTVVRSGDDLCWHTTFGPPPSPEIGCGGIVAAAQIDAPQPVTPAPAPAFVALATPVAAPVHVTLNADMLFDFDKATIRPAGYVALDAFVKHIKDINPQMIMAVGYTDRIGSDAYNQHLSEQRVEAVKGYLAKKGIAPDRMHVEGKGKTDPITKSGECTGARSAAVIACLQPDRRVEVDVQGNAVVK